jgi:hypothetical protein
MSQYRIAGLSTQLTDEVRGTRKSPGYGHPVVAEVATGTGPCRSCFSLFKIGEEERLLFTYQPASGEQTLGAPGPVFVHSEACARYEDTVLPEGLLALPLLIEGRRNDGTVLRSEQSSGQAAPGVVDTYLTDEQIDFVFLRHGEAGCHIARIDRV